MQRQASLQHYNSATRTVYVGDDPTKLRLPGVETGTAPARVAPRFYWRRRPGFDAAAVARGIAVRDLWAHADEHDLPASGAYPAAKVEAQTAIAQAAAGSEVPAKVVNKKEGA